jgi:hypothetical protein
VTASPLSKKPSPAAKRKFAKFQQSIHQSPQQHIQQTHHFYNHQHFHSDAAPKIPVTPSRPQSAKSRRLFSEDHDTPTVRQPVFEAQVDEDDDDDDQIEDEDDLVTPTGGDNKMDLDGSNIVTPPTNGFPSPNIFDTPAFGSPIATIKKKTTGTSTPTANIFAYDASSPDLFGADEDLHIPSIIRPSPSHARHLEFSDDEIDDDDESQGASDREVDDFDINLGSQSQMQSCTPPRLTQSLDGQSSQMGFEDLTNAHLVPFRLTNDNRVHENPFSPERNVRSVLNHSARKKGVNLSPSISASPRKSPRSTAKKPPVLPAGALETSGDDVINYMYFSRYAEDFEEEDVLGDGSFGRVTKCRNRFDGMTYAVKISKKQIRGKKDLDNTLKEVHALATLVDNPHIVRYFASWIEDERLHVQTELCEGGSLANEIKSRRKFTEDELISLLRQIACGLQQMHSHNIVHLDIKPENIYITVPGKFKIGDLGLAASSFKEFKDVTEGDSRYLCRELLTGDISVSPNTDLTKADIFALGMTIYETATLIELPNNGDEWHALRDGNLKHLHDRTEYSNEFIALLKLMMHPDPSRRPGAMDILQSDFITRKKPSYEELEKQNRTLEIMLKKQKEREAILTQQLLQQQQQMQQMHTSTTNGF